MHSNEILACLGRADDSREVTQILAALEVKKKIKLPRDEDAAYVEMPKQGLALIFRPEGPKTSRLALTAVKFYSDAEKGYAAFTGELPKRLSFADTKAETHKKLGEPTEVNDAMRLDVWRSKETVLAVKYAKDTQRIGVITVQCPAGD